MKKKEKGRGYLRKKKEKEEKGERRGERREKVRERTSDYMLFSHTHSLSVSGLAVGPVCMSALVCVMAPAEYFSLFLLRKVTLKEKHTMKPF